MIDQKTAPYAALLLRVSLGIMFIAHGLLKLMVFTLPGAAVFFSFTGVARLAGLCGYLCRTGRRSRPHHRV